MKTLYELKQNLVTIGQQLQKVESELSEKAIDPKTTTEEIQALRETKEDLKMRFDVIKQQHDALEAEQKAKLEAQMASQKDLKTIDDPKERLIKAKA